ILVTLIEGNDAGLVAELRAQLPRPLGEGRFRRVGVAVVPTASDAHRSEVVVALQESFIELQPIARAPALDAQVGLDGRLADPYRRPEAFVTAPDGKVNRLSLSGDERRFRGGFRCGPERGRYQVEVAGEDRFGAAVLANFPVYCGAAPPAALEPLRAHAGDDAITDAAQAEAVIARLVNADRARAGLQPLALDERLSRVARAHSSDMQAHGFLGHISPTTGSAADRLRRAGVDAQLVLENVARAYSPGEAERGLMDSPGHRANLLNSEVTLLGVGAVIAVGLGGVRELLVTQVFTRPTETLGAGSLADLRGRIGALRRQRSLAALADDPALDALAQSTARELGAGSLSPSRAGEPIDRALAQLADRYARVRSAVAVSSSLAGVVDGLAKPLTDPGVTACGIGLASGRRPDGSAALYAVIVLATAR